MTPWEALTGKAAEDFMKNMLKEAKAYDKQHPEKFSKFGYKWNKDTKYKWLSSMSEVSGFGGEYEECCRFMVTKMLEWLDEHPELPNPEYHGYENIYGVIEEDNETANLLRDYILKAVDDYFGKEWGPSGAQYQGTAGTVYWIRTHSWEEFVKIKKDQKNKEARKARRLGEKGYNDHRT